MENKTEFIEEMALNIFQSNTRLILKNNLTVEQKRGILDADSFKYYIEQATRVYEKKQKAVSNKKYKHIEISADGVSGMYGGAYTLCFVYSKFNGNFVVSGYHREVQKYLKENYTHYFYNMSLWNNGINRDVWGFWKDNIGIFHPSTKMKKEKIKVRKYYDFSDEVENVNVLSFRRLPKRWIPEFDTL